MVDRWLIPYKGTFCPMPHITGKDAKKMLNAKIPKKFVESIKSKKFAL